MCWDILSEEMYVWVKYQNIMFRFHIYNLEDWEHLKGLWYLAAAGYRIQVLVSSKSFKKQNKLILWNLSNRSKVSMILHQLLQHKVTTNVLNGLHFKSFIMDTVRHIHCPGWPNISVCCRQLCPFYQCKTLTKFRLMVI